MDTAVASNTANYQNLISNNMAEWLLGHQYWWTGRTYFVPAFPGADRGYFLKLACLVQYFPKFEFLGDVVEEGPPEDKKVKVVISYKSSSGEMVMKEVMMTSLLKTEVVEIPENVPSHLSSTGMIYVVAFTASGVSGVDRCVWINKINYLICV